MYLCYIYHYSLEKIRYSNISALFKRPLTLYVYTLGILTTLYLSHTRFEGFEDHKKAQIILVCDRYAAYKKFARENEEMIIILAFCWAHVRRDFLDAARSNPDNEDGMFRWVTDMGELYHLNQQRLEHWDKSKPLSKQSELFNQNHQNLYPAIDRFEQQIKTAKESEAPLKGEPKADRFKVVDSLSNHWKGLIVFVDNPQVPMDNNLAEQALRMPVVGLRSFYGSGAIWSAELATIMMG